MAEFKISRGLQENYNAIQEKDCDTIYICTDTGNSYLGSKKLDADWVNLIKPNLYLNNGLRVYYNGVDVTNDASMQQIVANAPTHWHGSQAAYNELADQNQLQPGVAYFIHVQPDWSETDPKHLGYIKNKPDIMDMTMEGTVANFYYL